MTDKIALIGLSPAQMTDTFVQMGLAPKAAAMRARQLQNWIYVNGVTDFAAMTNLAKEFRAHLDQRFSLARPEVADVRISQDGTRKWLLRTAPGIEYETVFIPGEGRGTLCVSSQVGCTLSCTFCHTGTQKLVRQLDPFEIVGQIMVARDALDDWPSGRATNKKSTGARPGKVESSLPSGRATNRQSTGARPGKVDSGFPSGCATNRKSSNRRITNVVMMGMGEPLYNFENVKAAIAIMADGDGLALSKRRITLSTAGVVPMIARAGAEIGSMLAISLHAARDELRNRLVPLNKKYPIAGLMQACRTYPGVSNARRITFEYVMLKGVNDSLADARALVKLIAGIPAKINLIPFNPWPGAPYECSEWDQIEKFAEIVNRAGYASPVRIPRGRDIMAACGQLKSASVKAKARDHASACMARLRSEELARMPG